MTSFYTLNAGKVSYADEISKKGTVSAEMSRLSHNFGTNIVMQLGHSEN